MKLTTPTLTSGMRYLSSLPLSFLSNAGNGNTPASSNGPAWDEEKTDILERAEWLAGTVITTPERLIVASPKELGPNFGGQWAIYSCCMFCHALANICTLYPDQSPKCLERMAALIELAKAPELRQYDTRSWREDALASLDGDKSHLSYLSLLAWMISEYRLAGGASTANDSLYEACCEALNRRMCSSADFNIPTFSNGVIFIPDMVPALIALNNYAKLYDGRYAATVEGWKSSVKANWIHRGTGMLLSQQGHGRSSTPRGSYSALTCSYLSMLDEEFAREQYDLMKKNMAMSRTVLGKRLTGIREYLHSAPSFTFDPDAGPIVQGFSASGTAFALGAATRLDDWGFRKAILSSAEIAGNTQRGRGERHYRLAEMALVGEAVALAMRTNVAK